jgi:hypothetical protein
VQQVYSAAITVPVLQGPLKRSLSFVGVQHSPDGSFYDLWNPLQLVGEIPAGSTFS